MARQKPHRGPAGQGQRQRRVGELIRHALAEIFMRGEVNDPVLERIPVTVTAVDLSPDLQNAVVFVQPLGGQEKPLVLEALNLHAGFLRGEVGHRVQLRFAPRLKFELDPSFETAAKIDALLNSPEVAADLVADPELKPS